MKYGILNKALGIAVIEGVEDLEDIQAHIYEEQMPEGAGLKDLVFFYMPDRDWIVINKNHRLYEFYSELISTYLELSADSRKEVHFVVLSDSIKEGCNILDDVIRRRILLHGKAMCQESNTV